MINIQAVRDRFRTYRNRISDLEEEVKSWKDNDKFMQREWAEEARMYKDIESENRDLHYQIKDLTGRW